MISGKIIARIKGFRNLLGECGVRGTFDAYPSEMLYYGQYESAN